MTEYQNLLTQNQALAGEVKRQVDYLAAINTIAASVSQSLDVNQTLQTALDTLLDITGAEAGGISLIEEGSGDVILRAQKGWAQDFVNTNPMRVPRGTGMSGDVIERDVVLVENDLHPSHPFAVKRFNEEAFRSIVMAPMHARGKIIGILSIMSFEANRFDEEMITVLRAIADTVGVALDNSRLYEKSVENQKQLGAILQSTADGIIATDCMGRVKLMNQAAVTMLDVQAEVMQGKMLRNAPLPASMRDSLQFALSSRGESDRTFLVTLESGRALSVVVSEIAVESQVDQLPETEGWVIVLQDVTHLREAETARTRFIQAAAHDMRNPLGVAQNSLDMLKRRLMNSGDETISEIMSIATSSIDRLQGLIEDLFNLEHIQGGYGFNLEDVDMGELAYEVSSAAKPGLEKRGMSYRTELEAGIAPIRIDRQWVTRAIANYLDNAIKYSPPGSQIALHVFTSGALVHIEVRDNGPGVRIEQQPRLFERFYRANEDETTPGTGLGLAIVKSVAEAHGGGVYIKSSPGSGSIFGMTLRRNAEPVQAAYSQ